MDIQRPEFARRRRIRFIAITAVLLLAGGGVAYALLHLKPAAMEADRASLLIDTVRHGSFVREVRGVGTLVPLKILVVAANVEGRVTNRYVLPGTPLAVGTLMFDLANPKIEQDLFEAESQLKGAEADLVNLRATLDGQLLAQQSTTASVRSEYEQAAVQRDANKQLASQGLIDSISVRKSVVAVEQSERRLELETKRIESTRQTAAAQMGSQQARIEQLRGLVGLRKQQLADLHVRSGLGGVLQSVDVEIGTYVTAGTVLARVSDPKELKAQIRIAETQAKDITFNQQAVIDTRNGTLPGHVTRIDPGVKDGSVTIDVALDAPLPPGARPDLSVDGVIRLENVSNVLFTGRVAEAQPGATISLFKLEPGGAFAERVPVRLGRISVNEVEVAAGLREGDQIILSDTSTYRDAQRIRIR
jgi:HlyD family secretion protein